LSERLKRPSGVEFTIAAAIEFTPTQPGRYEFTCGMNMFRGTIEVSPGANDPKGAIIDHEVELSAETPLHRRLTSKGHG